MKTNIRRRRLALVLAILTLLAVPTIAVAAHFTDVNPNSTHAPGIDYLEGTGITAGCTATEYCPGDNVRRDQMATFIHRLSGHAPGVDPSVNAASLHGIQVVTSDNTVGAGSTANPNTVACPNGTLAVGGGGTAAIGWVLKDSNPLDGLAGWRVQHRTADGNPIGVDSTNTVYAVCIPSTTP